jgi:hypothetical protein
LIGVFCFEFRPRLMLFKVECHKSDPFQDR